MLDWLLPASLNLADFSLLLMTSFTTATLTAVLGVGGGVLLLAVVATVLPPVAIIPVHGMVQTGANGNRALMTRRHIDTPLLRSFIVGAMIGALIAGWVVVQLPVEAIQLCIALFVLYLTWGPKLQAHHFGGWRLQLAATITTLISMFVGASGPLVAAFVQRTSADRFVRVATFSACMCVQHGLKLLVFGWIGFAFSEWLGLILAMILAGMAGTWVGLHLLSKVSNAWFDKAFKVVLTLLALRLFYAATTTLLSPGA